MYLWREIQIRPIVILLSLLLLLSWWLSGQTQAQQIESEWSTPLNLSRSGTAIKSVLVADDQGSFHVFWQDAFDGFTYTSGDGQMWTEPVVVLTPFTEPPYLTPAAADFDTFYAPLLRPGSQGQIHAFWQNEDAVLFHSRVAGNAVTEPAAWSTTQQVASAAIIADAQMDENGRLHLAYLRPISTPEAPAGVYYRASDDGGDTWSEAVPLYLSEYLRTITAEQAHLQLAATGNLVAVVWDNPVLESVFFIRSGDRGGSWSEAEVIDARQPDDLPEVAGPAHIAVAVRAGELHLVWRAQHGQESCRVLHQWSPDGGESWTAVNLAFTQSLDCAITHDLFVGADDLLFLAPQMGQAVFWQAWDGERWSEPIVQKPLSGFTDPATYRTVALNCQASGLTNNNDLVIVGCGQTPLAQDVWAMSRPLGGLEVWSASFAPKPAWSRPAPIFSDGSALSSLVLTPGENEAFHAFWLTADVETTSNTIYYAAWDGMSWSRPAPVFSGNVDQLAAVDGNGRLYLIWRDPVDENLFFRQVTIERALFPSDWSEPQALFAVSTAVSEPGILALANGRLLVNYTLPLNESRGVYLLSSDNEGTDWSEPIVVFDASADLWDKVERSQLVADEAGALHMIFMRYSLPQNNPQSLYYTRSTDEGQTWTAPIIIAEGLITWAEIISADESLLSVVWQAVEDDVTRLWHRFSQDGGVQWQETLPLPGFGDLFSLSDASADSASRVYALRTVGSAGEIALQSSLWVGEGWIAEVPLAMDASLLEISALQSAIDEYGQYSIIFVGSQIDPATDQPQDMLFHSDRRLQLPEGSPTPRPTLTPSPTPSMEGAITTPQSSPTPTVMPTRIEIVGQNVSAPSGPFSGLGSIGAMIFGVFPVLTLVGTIFFVVFWRYKRR